VLESVSLAALVDGAQIQLDGLPQEHFQTQAVAFCP
jgi:hypothetical protein